MRAVPLFSGPIAIFLTLVPLHAWFDPGRDSCYLPLEGQVVMTETEGRNAFSQVIGLIGEWSGLSIRGTVAAGERM